MSGIQKIARRCVFVYQSYVLIPIKILVGRR